MECQCKKSGKVCFSGGVCLHEDELPDILQSMSNAQAISRVKLKCRRLDEFLVKQGKKPVIEQTLIKSICPLNKSRRNAEIVTEIEEIVIDPVLKAIGAIKEN